MFWELDPQGAKYCSVISWPCLRLLIQKFCEDPNTTCVNIFHGINSVFQPELISLASFLRKEVTSCDDSRLSAASNTAGSNPTNIIPAFYLILYSVMCEALCTEIYKWFQHHSLRLYIQSRYSIPATIMSTSPLSVSSSSMIFLFEV